MDADWRVDDVYPPRNGCVPHAKQNLSGMRKAHWDMADFRRHTCVLAPETVPEIALLRGNKEKRKNQWRSEKVQREIRYFTYSCAKKELAHKVHRQQLSI